MKNIKVNFISHQSKFPFKFRYWLMRKVMKLLGFEIILEVVLEVERNG